jgi:predicted ATPase
VTGEACDAPCACAFKEHAPRLVVLTGGPGAGKTAVLELIRKAFCQHVAVLPEAASIVFGGGFPRQNTAPSIRAAQRAIFHVQRELEALVVEEHAVAVALCDRGTLDGLAYWPESDASWCDQLHTTVEAELARYAAVIHLRTPAAHDYNHVNPLRVEDAAQAEAIDQRIQKVWERHPRRYLVDSSVQFLDKVMRTLAHVRQEVPACCRQHELATDGLR